MKFIFLKFLRIYEKLLKTEQILKYFPCINVVFLFPGCKTALDVPHYRSYVYRYPIYACASVFNRMSFFQSFVRNVKVNTERVNIIISVVEPEPVKINRPRAAAVWLKGFVVEKLLILKILVKF